VFAAPSRPVRWLRAGVGMAAALVPVILAAPVGASHDHGLGLREGGGRVVLVGIPGLRWRDVRPADTPTLWRLLDDAAVATMSVRTVRRSTCPSDGWLSVNAGARAVMERPGGDGAACPDLPRPRATATGYQLPGWAEIVAYNARFSYDPQFGLLGEQAQARGCSLAVGPGAALALADASGRGQRYVPSVGSADFDECPLTLVDLGAVDHATTVREIDKTLATVAQRVPPSAQLLIAGLSDSSFTPFLHAVLARGVGFGRGWLTAPSTRHEGLVQLTDLTPTVLAGLGVEAGPRAVGAVMHSAPGRPADPYETGQRLVDRDTAAQVIRDSADRFFTGLVLGQLIAYPLLALAYRRLKERRRSIAWATAGTALVFAAAPVASFLANLVPWWTFAHPAAVLWATVTGSCVLVGLLALVGPWRPRVFGPPGFVAALTAAVLAVDVIVGSPLQVSSLYGLSALVAGRFYGFGNVAFAVFAMTALLAATWAAATALRRGRKGAAALAVTGIGAAAVVVDGWPAFGADFGGVIAMVPGFAVLAFGVAGVRLSVARMGGVGLVAGAAVSGIALLDWARPPGQRSHLGRFVQQILDGDAGAVLQRKIDANLSSLTRTPPLAVLVPVLVVVLAVIVVRPRQMGFGNLARAYEAEPALRAGLVGCLVTAVLGFAVNDSGIVVPAVALAVAVPLGVAAWAAAAHQRLGTPPPEPPGSAPVPARRAQGA